MGRTVLDLPYLMAVRAKGRTYVYYRRDGRRTRLPDPSDPGFRAAYDRAHGAAESQSPPPLAADAIGAVITAYLDSAEFRARRPRTQRDYRLHHANKRLAVTSLLLTWAAQRGWIAGNPVAGAPKIRTHGGYSAWPQAAIAAAIDGLRPDLALAVALIYWTGQRPGDAIRMTWAQYDGDAIHIVQGKTGQALSIPVHPRLRAMLDEARQRRRDSGVMTTTLIAGGTGKPYAAVHGLDQALRRGLAAIGLPAGLTPHGLRKSLTGALGAAGATHGQIQAYQGWRTGRMVDHYTGAQMQAARARHALDLLLRYEAAQPPAAGHKK